MSAGLDLAERLLKNKESEIYNKEYPVIMYDKILDIDTEVRGEASVIDVTLNRQVANLDCGLVVQFTNAEIQPAYEALQARALEGAYEECQHSINNQMLFGTKDIGGDKTGLYNDSRVDKSLTGIDLDALSATGAQAIATVFDKADKLIRVNSKGLYRMEQIVVPDIARLATTLVGNLVGNQVLSLYKFLEKSFKDITILEDPKLLTAGASGKDRIVVMSRKKKAVEGVLPSPPVFGQPVVNVRGIAIPIDYKCVGTVIWDSSGMVYMDLA
ncbi:MAG: DUF2184 domain-containing protein [Candidatus Endonucleobacter sp. (ex Gigantidas childressi)]|nr:DUF2184 domain-containing protein [Candidatus Endonucleobacter sp. (ex Gigantidas childressi)]